MRSCIILTERPNPGQRVRSKVLSDWWSCELIAEHVNELHDKLDSDHSTSGLRSRARSAGVRVETMVGRLKNSSSASKCP